MQAFRGDVSSSSELARESEERFDADDIRLKEAGTILIGRQRDLSALFNTIIGPGFPIILPL